nr:AlpA family phage regulatory protein [uncultured Halomonas sp.]
MTPETIRAFLTVRQVAHRYGVGVATIWRWSRNRDDFPQPRKLGDNCTRWAMSDLKVWEEKEVA